MGHIEHIGTIVVQLVLMYDHHRSICNRLIDEQVGIPMQTSESDEYRMGGTVLGRKGNSFHQRVRIAMDPAFRTYLVICP